MEFEWDPLDFSNQIQSNPMKIPWKTHDNLMKTNKIQWNSMGSIRFPQSDAIKSNENPMKIPWKSNENLMKTNGIQWNSNGIH